AAKWTGAGWVEVRAWQTGGGLHVEVQDTGPGIPPGLRERIFEPFERGVPPTGSPEPEEEGKGLGLGLAIVRRYVHAHGGTVTVSCPPEGGSCFSLFLPQ